MYPQCVWYLLCWTVCFLKRYIYNRIKSVSPILKVKMNFSLQKLWNSVRSKWDIYTPVHCQLHHYHISYIMRKQEIIHLTTFSTHNWKNCSSSFHTVWSKKNPSWLWLVMSAYASFLTTPLLFTIIENTNQHFELSIIGDIMFPYFLKILLELLKKR